MSNPMFQGAKRGIRVIVTNALRIISGLVGVLWLAGCMQALELGNSPSQSVSTTTPSAAVEGEGTITTSDVEGMQSAVISPTVLLSPSPVATTAPLLFASAENALPTDIPTPSASATPTNTPFPTTPPTPIATIPAPTFPVLTNEERWRRQQGDRQVFDTPQPYTTSGSELWWYDPVNQQHIILGSFAGDFEATATFTLRGQGIAALEVIYHVNQSYGLTAISSALVDRINAAGYGDTIETYVFLTPDIQPR